MTDERILSLSCIEKKFKKAKFPYKSALENTGFNYIIKFEALAEKAIQNGDSNIIWLEPPFSINVKKNIGKAFLELERNHFPRSHKFNKIFNSNTIKISYSSMLVVVNLMKPRF